MPQRNRLLYLIGVPGAGKSTVAAELTRHWVPVDLPVPVPHRAWLDACEVFRLVTLGRHRERFAGTDTLGMSIQPKVIDWLTGLLAPRVVFGEGDRLGNGKFFDAMAAGWDLTVAYLDTPDEVAAERRNGRGSNQDPSWLAGRATKVRNLAKQYPVIVLDGRAPAADNGAILRDHLGLS